MNIELTYLTIGTIALFCCNYNLQNDRSQKRSSVIHIPKYDRS
ncbi:MAG: hypothetical protein ACO3NK_13825 [Prochlorotrichaceae cyanobacterium]